SGPAHAAQTEILARAAQRLPLQGDGADGTEGTVASRTSCFLRRLVVVEAVGGIGPASFPRTSRTQELEFRPVLIKRRVGYTRAWRWGRGNWARFFRLRLFHRARPRHAIALAALAENQRAGQVLASAVTFAALLAGEPNHV